jgi:hypothetical protein
MQACDLSERVIAKRFALNGRKLLTQKVVVIGSGKKHHRGRTECFHLSRQATALPIQDLAPFIWGNTQQRSFGAFPIEGAPDKVRANDAVCALAIKCALKEVESLVEGGSRSTRGSSQLIT